MDISSDFLSDMRSGETQSSAAVSSAAVSDAMQEQDALAAKIDSTNKHLVALDARLNDLITMASPTLATAARIVEGTKIALTPETKADLKRQAKQMADDQAKLIYRGAEASCKFVEEHFGKKVTNVCNRLLSDIDKQSQKHLDAIKDQTDRSIYEIERVTNLATERIRYAAGATIIPTMTYNILMALLFMSLSLNVTIATLNIILWHHPSLSTLLWPFAGLTAALLAIIYILFRRD